MSVLDLDEILGEKQRLSQKSSGDSGYLDNFIPMPQGNGVVIVRLLPPAAKGTFGRDKNPFYVATRIHRVNEKSLHCPRVLQDKKWVGECPICKYYSWLWKESEKPGKTEEEKKALQQQARQIKPTERYYYNAIMRAITNSNSGKVEVNANPVPKILSIGQMIHGKIIRGITGDEELQEPPLGDVTDVKAGRDFKIVKQMRKGNDGQEYPNYSESKFQEPSPLGSPDQVQQWFANMHDLVALRNVLPYDELKRHLRVHLGLEKDTNSDSFDPSEFQKPSAREVEVTVSHEKAPAKQAQPVVEKAATVVTPAPQQPEADPAAELLGEDTNADEDFLAALKAATMK